MPRFAVLLCACLLVSAAAFAEVQVSDIALIEDDPQGSINNQSMLLNGYLKAAACQFYLTHDDNYDALFIFTTIPQNSLTNTPQGWPVKQDQQGIGRDNGGSLGAPDQTQDYCSWTHRLRHVAKLGDLRFYPDKPDNLYAGPEQVPLSGLGVMGHEFGHYWLASVMYDKGDGAGVHCMLRAMTDSEANYGDCDGLVRSAFNLHWSHYFNSRSLMYGSFIEDNGDGSYRVWYDDPKFSEFDQYLMGLRLPEEVEQDLFIVIPENSGGLEGSSRFPLEPGVEETWIGQRYDFSVDDVIRAMGPRVPALDACHWKAAIMVVHAYGQVPTHAELEKLANYANGWERYYEWATDGRGSMDLTIDGRGRGTESCPAPGIPEDGDIDGEMADGDLPSDGDESLDGDAVEDDIPVGDGDWSADGDKSTDGDDRTDGDRDETDSTVSCDAGTVECVPGVDAVRTCLADGSGWRILEDCSESDLVCDNGACVADGSGSVGGGCNTTAQDDGALWVLLLVGLCWRVKKRTYRQLA